MDMMGLSETRRPGSGKTSSKGFTYYFMSVVAVYAPTEVCETEKKEMFYAILDSVLDQCPRRDALIVLGDFNAVTGTDRVG